MSYKNRFTKIELAVVLACVLILLANLGAIGSGGRERAKRAVCLSNLKQLTLAWIIYANENDDKLINGDPEEYGSFGPPPSGAYAPGGEHYCERPWVRRDWQSGSTEPKGKNPIEQGALFPYCKDVRLYKCPITGPNDLRGYSIVDAMNCKGWDSKMVMLKKRSQIDRPGERFVFVDDGGTAGATMGGWTCYADRDQWWDPPPIHHNDGTNFSFADGHNEYWKWKDQRTVAFGKTGQAFSGPQPGNIDIRRTQLAAWGAAAIR